MSDFVYLAEFLGGHPARRFTYHQVKRDSGVLNGRAIEADAVVNGHSGGDSWDGVLCQNKIDLEIDPSRALPTSPAQLSRPTGRARLSREQVDKRSSPGSSVTSDAIQPSPAAPPLLSATTPALSPTRDRATPPRGSRSSTSATRSAPGRGPGHRGTPGLQAAPPVRTPRRLIQVRPRDAAGREPERRPVRAAEYLKGHKCGCAAWPTAPQCPDPVDSGRSERQGSAMWGADEVFGRGALSPQRPTPSRPGPRSPGTRRRPRGFAHSARPGVRSP